MNLQTAKRSVFGTPARTGIFLAIVIGIIYIGLYRELFTCVTTFRQDALIWYGTFHYYLEQLKKGTFPYWDPFSMMGTYFYPNISGYGLLDPCVLLCTAVSKIFRILPLTLFIYFRLYRIIFFVASAFLLYRHVSKNTIIAVLSAGILLFTVTQQNISMPMMDYCFTVPAALYLLLLLLEHIEDRKRYRYAFALALVTGVTINVFIPALYFFNIAAFTVVLFWTRTYHLSRVARALADRKMILCMLVCILLVFMMASPPLTVSFLDTTTSGELFAVSKLADANNGNFKQMMASEAGGDLFLDKLRQDQGTFLSYGSLLSLLSPDAAQLRFRPASDTSPVISLYIGVMPLMLILVGIRGFPRSGILRAVVITGGLVLLVSFSINGVYSSYNNLQRLVNDVFPPLRMLDTRLNFASLLSFYLCMVLSLSVAAAMQAGRLQKTINERFRRILFLGLLPLAAKTCCLLTMNGVLFLNGYDAAGTLISLLGVLGIISVRYGIMSAEAFLLGAMLLSVADVAATSIPTANMMTFSAPLYDFLAEKAGYRSFTIHEAKREHAGFVYFRLPNLPSDLLPIPSFIPDIVGIKSAFISNTYFSIFSTKRYYDMFSLLRPERQFALDGILYPIVRFFSADRALIGQDPRRVLQYLNRADSSTLKDRLVVEIPSREKRKNAVETLDLRRLKDVTWVGTGHVVDLYQQIIPELKNIRENMTPYLHTDAYSLHVVEFSTNTMAVDVVNKVEGYLLYTDGWSKYWKAFDGGKELPVLIGNYNSKAVFLQRGKHLLRFVFDPRPYRISLILYHAGLVICTLLIIIFGIAERPRLLQNG